jgi:putative hydrolase of the HAD superfamily
VTPLHRVGIEVVGLDADDTLWHSERDFAEVQHRYRALLAHYGAPDLIESVLLATERRNLIVFGYGVKGFMLSMIETAIEISGQRITGAEIHQIVELGRSLIERPLELLPGVHAAVEALSADYRVVLITKGDLIHQETKIAASGLGELFWRVEVVSEKNPTTYRRLLERLAVDPARFVMVGNSLQSDILPVLDIGGRAVHVPYEITWALDHGIAEAHHSYAVLESLADLQALLGTW